MHTVSCAVNRTKSNLGEQDHRALIWNAKGELKASRKMPIYLDTSRTGTGL